MKMLKNVAKLGLIAAAIVLAATSPGASSQHFVMTNDGEITGSNTATVLKLSSPSDPTLSVARTLTTGRPSKGGNGIPSVQMIEQGSGGCIFVSDGEAGDIASFAYPAWSKIGNYVDPQVTDSTEGILISARSRYLVAAYNGQNSQAIGIWSIGSHCTLSLLNTVSASDEFHRPFSGFENTRRCLFQRRDTAILGGFFLAGAGREADRAWPLQ